MGATQNASDTPLCISKEARVKATAFGGAMKIRNVSTILMLLGSLFALTGCPSAGVYRTAHTLGQGESDVGLTFS